MSTYVGADRILQLDLAKLQNFMYVFCTITYTKFLNTYILGDGRTVHLCYKCYLLPLKSVHFNSDYL